MTTIINGSSPSITFSDGSAQTSATRPFLNRLINGGMTIDQRNAGASVTPSSNYTLDRWRTYDTQSSKFTIQQDAGAVTPPTGFTDYLGITSTSAYSISSGDYFSLFQRIEGFNVADLGWGTANAKTVTLSFWVRSGGLTYPATFGGNLTNANFSRSYPFSYTISSANTWEYKTITIAGDTTGTWLTTNGSGIEVQFAIGVGSSNSGTAGAWTGGWVPSVTGAVSVVGTNGATLYITGVQLEVGSTATSFDYRPYGTELQLCQRYYYNIFGTAADFQAFGCGVWLNSTVGKVLIDLPVPLRSVPTLEAASIRLFDAVASTTRSATGFGIAFTVTPTNKAFIDVTVGSSSSAAGDTCLAVLNTSTSARIGFSSEL